MSKQIINVGSGELAGDGEGIRTAFIKINSNFNELYSNTSTGYTGSIGYAGSQGNVGYTGSASTGTTGYTGSQGNVGYTGSVGTGSSIVSIVRAEKSAGNNLNGWTFTTVSGSVTGEWAVDATTTALGLGSAASLIFTLNGFTRIPLNSYYLDINGQYDVLNHIGLVGTYTGTLITGFTNFRSPNILTAFSTSSHKVYLYGNQWNNSNAQDLYFYFKD